ncbi:PD40 domain-containing protein [Chitinophaga sp. S165]|uniref:PD40 domain-containing protein n=1 Tax=Chitinophaga sp. S165 TaxID=2135462 RepID=UPI000D716722|nr:PD40 domain-containing protein [Chitinophaga sp. S165]
MGKILRSLTIFILAVSQAAGLSAQHLGIFDGQTDVGKVKHTGSLRYDPKTQQYTVSGAGNNMWFGSDEFHFVWKKMKGDFILRTNARFLGKGTELHRKWGLMIRSSLDTNATHVNGVVHGDGLTSLQYRKTPGAVTEEIKSSLTAADVVQLERKGNTFTLSVAKDGQTFISEKLDNLSLGDEVYAGLFVCSHNADVVEKAVFSNVRIAVPAPDTLVAYRQYIGSLLELLDINTLNSTIVYQTPGSIQAPNWNTDGKSLIYNADGLLYQFDLAKQTPSLINTGIAKRNNNDHVLSFDGKMLAISSGDGEKGASVGYVVPRTGGDPTRINKIGPSYIHGWSPDGKYLVFTGQRNNDFDIYRVPAAGGEEVRLTTAPGLDDGPEYTPDGKYIYFNSVRSGLMQIWRMKADGSEQTQITNDQFNNWFPHISPDGKWIVFLTFLKEEVEPSDHPFYKRVYLRLMPASGGPSKVIAYLYGGQGTINTPSWSPDSKRIAFISNSKLLYPIFPIGK